MYCGDLKVNSTTTISVGPALDDDDAVTQKTGTLADTDFYLSKNGGAKANPNDTNDATHDADGVHLKQFNGTDLNTEGLLTVYMYQADILYIRQDYTVLSEAAYEFKYTAKDAGAVDVNLVTINDQATKLEQLMDLTTGVAADGDISGIVVDSSVLSHVMTPAADAATYLASTDSLEATRNHIGDGTTLTEAGGDGDHLTKVAVVSTGLDLVLKSSTFALAIADAIWDEATSGHVTKGSFGVLGELIQTQGVVETSGSNSTTQVQTDLAEATDDHYDVMTIFFLDGTEAGQSRLITGYTGATGVVSWNAALTGTPADGTRFVIIVAGTTADAVWDEILTGQSHNIATSAGKRLRQIEEAFIHADGVIATVTNGHTFTLDAGAVATADYYVGDRLQITEGTGAGQSRLIVAYTSGKVVTLDSDYTTNPDTSSLYEVDAADVHVSLSDADQAQGFVATYTDTTTITLDSAAVGTTDYYLGSLINFTHGTGAGQVRDITGYTNGRVVTMSPALATALDTTTVWHIQAAVTRFATPANVNAEVLDVLNVDTFAEPGDEIPTSTTTLVDKISYLYKFLRNKVETTATKIHVYDDAGANVDHTSTISDDDTTFSRGEFGAGE